mmetsp:Transcript_63005/g.117860  ORF Transcript_63005/g.117860 Transcript_63005/m.117860 type:complete len:569 (+) Transcript_63005:97-1803(+)
MRCVLALSSILLAAHAEVAYNLGEGDEQTSLLQRGAEALHSRGDQAPLVVTGPGPTLPPSLPEQLGQMRPALWAVSCVTVLYFSAYAVLAIIHAFNQAQEGGPGPLEKALESAVMGVCFAPMLCVLFLSVYKRADTLGAGEPYTYGLPPDYVRVAMAVSVAAFVAQMVSYTGREWTIHKQAGRPVRRVPAFWNNAFNLSMLCMYLAVAVTLLGLIQMQQPSQLQEEYGSLPLSAGIFCSNSILVLYFAVYAALQIAKTMDVDFCERGTHPTSLTDPARYVIEVLKMTAESVQVAPMLAVLCIGVQLTVDARGTALFGIVETAMYVCCLALFIQAAITTATPFVTNSELKVVPGTVDIIDFGIGQPRLYNLMSALRWVSTALLYMGLGVICSYLWSQHDAPAWSILVMHLGTYFFIVHLCLFLCVSFRQMSNASMMEGIRTLTTAKDAVGICPMLAVLFMESWVAAHDLQTPFGMAGVPQGFAQDYMFVATWAMLMQLIACFINGFVYTMPKDSKVMRFCGNALRGGLTAISIVFYMAMVTVYASILVVLVSRYTNTPRSATGVGAWFA